jgi:hypothetical protein
MPTTEQTVSSLVTSAEGHTKGKLHAFERRCQSSPLSDPSRHLLNGECRSLAKYLVGLPSSTYIEEQYALATQAHGLAYDKDFSCFDRATLNIARRGRLLARCTDAYCALFCRNGALRRKLILLAAILEHVTPTNEAFDRVDPRSAAGVILSLGAYGLTSAVSLLLGFIFLWPTGVLCWIARHVTGSNVSASQAP